VFPDILQHIDPSTYFSDNYIVLDFETAHFERGFPDPVVAPWAKLHLAVYKTGDVYYYNWKDEYHQRILVELCESVDFVVAHNSKFELGWLKRCGIDLTRAVVWDTMIAENVIAGNRKWDLTLEGTCSRWGLPGKVKGVSKMLGAGICPSDIPDHLLLEYCKTDVKVTEQVFLKQLEYMKTTKLLPEVFIECLAVPVLTDMEFQGLPLRKQETINVYTEAVYKKNELDLKLNKITGGINLNSPKQRSEFLFNEMKFPLPKDYKGNVKKTATGQVSTGKDTIEKLKCKTKKQKDFIELYKERNKITAAIDKPLKGCYNCVMESNDPLLYGSFNQTVAGTHRLTSTGKSHKIQLQNFPNAYKYLVGKEGHKILNVDYSSRVCCCCFFS
jgi:DNA polymerase I-like protein with 3'-5' exonuclease and polymerase domains